MEQLWVLTQDPEAHVRWDVRFSSITPAAQGVGAGHFTYRKRVGPFSIEGTGVSVGERQGSSGQRTSALKFHTADRISPIRSGSGYWKYRPEGEYILFSTGYDYAPGWGRLPDLLIRPILGWATAYSFDRLRIWAEQGTAPERWPLAAALKFWDARRPRAARCARKPPGGRRRDDHLKDAPLSLSTLEEPRR